MRIKNVVKNIDNNGRVVSAYVVFQDDYGNEKYEQIANEMQFNYFMRLFNEQKQKEQERAKPKREKNHHANVVITPKVIGLTLVTAMAVAGLKYTLLRETPNFHVVTKIQQSSFGRGTEEDRYISRNTEAFHNAATILQNGQYDKDNPVESSFIRDFIMTCYNANVDDIIEGGRLDGTRYDFNFEDYMPASDRVIYRERANNDLYERIMKRYRSDMTLEELKAIPVNERDINSYLSGPLELILQHLDPKDDDFTKLSPFTRIVICEEVKSVLKLAPENYNFFNHSFPTRNQTRDELIEAIDKKENEAVHFLDMQILNGHNNDFMVGKQR